MRGKKEKYVIKKRDMNNKNNIKKIICNEETEKYVNK